MSEIYVEVIEQHAAELARRLESADLRPVLQACRPIALQAHRDNFTSSVDPDGNSWVPRKHPGDGHPLLMESGALMQAATGGGPGGVSVLEARDLTLGVDRGQIEYARIHNLGGICGGACAGAIMPQREYLGIQENRLQEMDRVVADGCLPILFGEAV